MKSNKKKPIYVALYGMDERTYKTMVMYLKGPCKGVAEVVDEFNAEIDLIDADYINAKEVLDERQSKTPDRPIILLSLERLSIDGIFYLKKPVQKTELLEVLSQAYSKDNREKPNNKDDLSKVNTESIKVEVVQDKMIPVNTDKSIARRNKDKIVTKTVEIKQSGEKNIDKDERKKTAKHRTAMNLTEGSFSSYLGHVEGLNYSDKEQVLNASYNPKHFFLGYVKSACRVVLSKGRIKQLNSDWKSLLILPENQEIWLDADDKQLRAYAGIPIKSKSRKAISLTNADERTKKFNVNLENIHDINGFIWKLAIWTSKGRYPHKLDINQPIYLKQWPNFTRLVVTPHALRISALLVREPRTVMNVIDALNIKPQYVFAFVSAAFATGLVGQAKRQADNIVAPSEPKESKTKGLLSRILGKLRG